MKYNLSNPPLNPEELYDSMQDLDERVGDAFSRLHTGSDPLDYCVETFDDSDGNQDVAIFDFPVDNGRLRWSKKGITRVRYEATHYRPKTSPSIPQNWTSYKPTFKREEIKYSLSMMSGVWQDSLEDHVWYDPDNPGILGGLPSFALQGRFRDMQNPGSFEEALGSIYYPLLTQQTRDSSYMYPTDYGETYRVYSRPPTEFTTSAEGDSVKTFYRQLGGAVVALETLI